MKALSQMGADWKLHIGETERKARHDPAAVSPGSQENLKEKLPRPAGGKKPRLVKVKQQGMTRK